MEELFEQIIYQAIKKNVSDIHLQCTEKGVIKFRICGELLTYETYEKTTVVTAFNAGDDLEPAADFGLCRVEDRLRHPDHTGSGILVDPFVGQRYAVQLSSSAGRR